MYGLLLRDVYVTAFLAHSLRKFVGFFVHHQCTKNRPRTLNKRELNASCHLVLDFCAIRCYFVNAYHSLRMELSRDNGTTIMPCSKQHDATPDFTQGDSCAWGDSHAWNTCPGVCHLTTHRAASDDKVVTSNLLKSTFRVHHIFCYSSSSSSSSSSCLFKKNISNGGTNNAHDIEKKHSDNISTIFRTMTKYYQIKLYINTMYI